MGPAPRRTGGIDVTVRILLTNDDGIDSEGLHVLARRMRRHGQVVVVAPDKEYSGAGAAIGPLHLIQPEAHRTTVEGIDESWAVNGPPALCVMFASLGPFGPAFDLVVSGINPGENVGRSVYHSGTVGAALTARSRGMNAVAVSQAVRGFGIEGQGQDGKLGDQHWDTAAAAADAVVDDLLAVLAGPPAKPVVVNLNVPNLPLDRVRGWRRTVVATVPTRALAGAALEPKFGHPGTFHVRMSWGDPIRLPADTDGGAVENDEISFTLLGPITEQYEPAAPDTTTSLDRLVSRAGITSGPP
jgi:5'-nucleotidase